MNKMQKAVFIITLILSVLMLCFLYVNINWFSSINKIFFNQIKPKNSIQIKPSNLNKMPRYTDYTYMIFDKNQNPLIDENFDGINVFNSDKTAFLVTKNYKKGLIDINGNYLLPVEYQDIININPEKKLTKAVYFDSKKHNSVEILFDEQYKEILHASEIRKKGDYFVLYEKDKNIYKILNSDLKTIHSFTINPDILNNKYILLKDSEEITLLNMEGKEILSGNYKSISYQTEKNGKTYFQITKFDLLHGITDDKNNIIVPCMFDNIKIVNDGFWARKNIYKRNEKAKHINKLAKYDFEGNFVNNADIKQAKALMTGTTPPSPLDAVDINKFPQRKVICVSKNRDEIFELFSFDELEALKKETKEANKQNYIKVKEKPKKQPLHKTNYKSDFLSSKINGNFTRLTCKLQPSFCKLSRNALSAKYCGKEGFYIADKELNFGKYYFEFQIENQGNNILSENTILSMIRFTQYKTATDAQKYKNSWKNNKSDIRLSRYSVKSKDIIGVAIDMNNAKVHIMVNGEWKTNPYSPTEGIELKKGKRYFSAFSVAGYNEVLTVNFGKYPFKYNMPDGYRAVDK